MILQSLVRYYEALTENGAIPRPGWAGIKISYALEINKDGMLLDILPLRVPSTDGKKMLPRELILPAPVKRTVGIDANFLWDNAIYMLGLDSKGDEARTEKCFEAAKTRHLALLSESKGEYARAIYNFFTYWSSTNVTDNKVAAITEELAKGVNLTFMFQERYPAEDKELCSIWQKWYDGVEDGIVMRCLVTGDEVVPVLTNPPIKGVRDAQSSGAALVSFNAPAYCSYGREQNLNAPISKYAAFAYTTALNQLISQKDSSGYYVSKLIGDTTTVFWTEDAQKQYQTAFASILNGDNDNTVNANDLEAFVTAISKGENAAWDGLSVKPSNKFYVLGLAPNAARLSVRFFLSDSFGNVIRHIEEHYKRLEIISDNRSKWNTIPLWALLQETVNKNAQKKSPSPQMSGDTLRAILTGGRYPATLYQQTQLRIHAERDITRGRAAIIKAYLLRNTNKEEYKEVLAVELNESTVYLPYVLGRLFSILEAIQQRANPGINATIKDKYFSSACTTPAVVFPTLLSLAEKHLRKMDTGAKIYYAKQLGEVIGMVNESYPVHLSLNDQGVFQLGYYHQTQKRFTKSNKEENETNNKEDK